MTLAVAFAAEGTSFARAFWQVRGEARNRREKVLDHVESSPDITVKVKLPLQPDVFIDPAQTRRTPQAEAARSPGRAAAEA